MATTDMSDGPTNVGEVLARLVAGGVHELEERWDGMPDEDRERVAATIDHLARAQASLPVPEPAPPIDAGRLTAAVWNAVNAAGGDVVVADRAAAAAQEFLRS